MSQLSQSSQYAVGSYESEGVPPTIVVDPGCVVDWGYPCPPDQPHSPDQPRYFCVPSHHETLLHRGAHRYRWLWPSLPFPHGEAAEPEPGGLATVPTASRRGSG